MCLFVGWRVYVLMIVKIHLKARLYSYQQFSRVLLLLDLYLYSMFRQTSPLLIV